MAFVEFFKIFISPIVAPPENIFSMRHWYQLNYERNKIFRRMKMCFLYSYETIKLFVCTIFKGTKTFQNTRLLNNVDVLFLNAIFIKNVLLLFFYKLHFIVNISHTILDSILFFLFFFNKNISIKIPLKFRSAVYIHKFSVFCV